MIEEKQMKATDLLKDDDLKKVSGVYAQLLSCENCGSQYIVKH